MSDTADKVEEQSFFQGEGEDIPTPSDDTPQNGVEPKNEDLPEEETADEGPAEEKDPSYWQSKYDKLQQEFEGVKPKVEKVERYGPLLEYLDDPDVLSAIEKQLAGGGQPAVNPQANGHSSQGASQDSPSLEEILSSDLPEPPEMPADLYDEEAMQKYRADMKTYQQKQAQITRAQQQYVRDSIEKQRRQEQQQQAMRQATHFLQKQYGLPPQEAQQFISDFQQPKVQEKLYGQLVKLWQQNRNAPQEKPNVDEDRISRLKNGNDKPPSPGATVPGEQESHEEKPSFFVSRVV